MLTKIWGIQKREVFGEMETLTYLDIVEKIAKGNLLI